MERKKPARKRGQEPKKGIWTAVKDNAALVTAILALFGVLISGAINTYIANKDQLAQQKLEVFNAQRQRDVEEQKAQDAALQTYLDQMGQMLLNEDLRSSEEDSDLRTLTRARTLTTLRRLDSSRKTAVVRFLVEANLVQRVDGRDPIIGLSGADLSGADLNEADLSGATLWNANLGGADLSNAFLREANLTGADLSGADLNEADLSGADLRGANNVTQEQLDEAASLEGATMPDGSKHP